MQFKLTITTECGARCKTCPCHEIRHHRTMTLPEFHRAMAWIESISKSGDTLFINSIGDYLCLPNAAEYTARLVACPLPVTITTNGLHLHELPDVHEVVISFNGADEWGYERTTGLPFETVLGNIRNLYAAAYGRNVEIHCLVCSFNNATPERLAALFAGWPGRIRMSYKVENQGGEDHTLPEFRKRQRFTCNYLRKVCIDPGGQVLRCSHDFGAWYPLAMIGDPLATIQEAQAQLIAAHERKEFTGLCEKCNYNVRVTNQVRYIK